MAKVLTIVSTGAKTTVSGVIGVKGAAETQYRDGYVNLTPENIGFTIVEVNEPEGTLSADELGLLKDNLFNCMGYGPDNSKGYIFRLISIEDGGDWRYGAIKEDLTGIMIISVDPDTGDYLYSYEESHTETQIETITEDVEAITQDVETITSDIADIQEEIASLKINGGEID